jgi:hypothetical protein
MDLHCDYGVHAKSGIVPVKFLAAARVSKASRVVLSFKIRPHPPKRAIAAQPSARIFRKRTGSRVK